MSWRTIKHLVEITTRLGLRGRAKNETHKGEAVSVRRRLLLPSYSGDGMGIRKKPSFNSSGGNSSVRKRGTRAGQRRSPNLDDTGRQLGGWWATQAGEKATH